MKQPRPGFVIMFLVAMCFTLATWLQPKFAAMEKTDQGGDLLAAVLGDARRMFGNHFFVKADVYFHNGYYPSIFDQARKAGVDSKHMTEPVSEHDEHEHEQAMDFLGQPQDWIDRFGRHFYSSTHSHMDKPGEAREILPWLLLSADLDPKRIETYTVASYWLRKSLGKADEAEQFLRQGLRANPGSYEILFELGKLYWENKHDPIRARNVWELALRRWQEQDAAKKNPDVIVCDGILANLANLEEREGNTAKALSYLELEVNYSPVPEAIKERIAEMKKKIAAGPGK